MTRREVAALCCRMVALFFLAWGVTQLVLVLPALGSAILGVASGRYGVVEGIFTPKVTMYGTLSCSLLLVAMGISWKAEAISHLMAADDPAPVTGPEFSAAALMPVACAGVGMFAITSAMPNFLRVMTAVVFTDSTLREYWDDDDWRTSLISDGLLFAWGIWLTFGSRGLIRLILWARSAKPDHAPDAEQALPSPPPTSAG
ncbi:MAG: hypothetical protein HY290_09010 [Planctomycetia bacterium]|nr:hypothetical protein [Planctomycetia bacterium]